MTMATPATVNFALLNNVWFNLVFRFGVLGDTTWSFTGKHFLCDFKADPDDRTPAMALSSIGSSPAGILVLDPVARILQFNVSDTVLRTKLPVGSYKYDLIMVDDVTGERDPLMQGRASVVQGITIED
jgi:hypothetical protein